MSDEVLRELRNIARLLDGQESRREPAHERPLAANKAALGALGVGGGGPSEPFHVVDFFRDGLDPGAAAGFDTFVLIDRDNSTGRYTHAQNAGAVKLSAAAGHVLKVKANDQWEAALCVVLRIDATDADMAVLEFNSLHANDTSEFQTFRDSNLYPLELDLTVQNGALRYVTPAQVILNDTTVNTTTGLDDVTGANVTPEVGDVLIRTTRVLGNGNGQVEFSGWYRVNRQ